MLDFFTNLHLTESQVRYLGLIILFSVIDSLRCLWIESLQKKYPVNAGAGKGSILGHALFPLFINDRPDDVIGDITIYSNDITLYSKCDQASDPWQKLELASELEFDL